MQQPDNSLMASPDKAHSSSWWALPASVCRNVKSYFLPGNEKERLVRASQTLYDSMHTLVISTNRACEIVEQHLNMNLPRVEVTDTMSIAEIIGSLVSAMQGIHSTAENTEKHVRKNLSPTMYDKLVVSRTSLEEKYAIIHDFQETTMGIFGNTCGPVVSVLLKRGDLRGNLEEARNQLEESPVLARSLQDLLLSSDDIACAVQGEKEVRLHLKRYSPLTSVFSDGDAKAALEGAAGRIEAATAVLRPVSERIQFIVTEAETYCELITEAGI